MNRTYPPHPGSHVHEGVDISSVDYTPEKPFKGIHCNVAGVIVLTGSNGNTETFTLAAGMSYPYGGSTVVKTGSEATANAFIALF